jgi:hypothetical protein
MWWRMQPLLRVLHGVAPALAWSRTNVVPGIVYISGRWHRPFLFKEALGATHFAGIALIIGGVTSYAAVKK